jgi:hypothetical protein
MRTSNTVISKQMLAFVLKTQYAHAPETNKYLLLYKGQTRVLLYLDIARCLSPEESSDKCDVEIIRNKSSKM